MLNNIVWTFQQLPRVPKEIGIELIAISRSFTTYEQKKTRFSHENEAKMTPTFFGLPNGSQGFQRYRNDCHFKIFYNIEKQTIFSRENDADVFRTSQRLSRVPKVYN